MCDRVVSEYSFLIVYCLDKFLKQKMCDEAVDDSLATLKPILDWFVTSKMIKNIFTAFFADENMHYLKENSGNVLFIMGILNITLDNNFHEDDPDTIILIRLLDWHIKFEKRKALKKYKLRINASSVAS